MFKIKTPLYIDGFDSSDYMISFRNNDSSYAHKRNVSLIGD